MLMLDAGRRLPRHRKMFGEAGRDTGNLQSSIFIQYQGSSAQHHSAPSPRAVLGRAALGY